MFRIQLGLPCCLLLAACAGTDDTALLPGADPASGDADRALFDTVVRVSPDGTLTELTLPVSAEERAAQLEARRARVEGEGHAADPGSQAPAPELGQSRAALSVNPACSVYDLWLYDADFSHRLCISGADLSINEVDYLALEDVTYCRPGGISDRICLTRVSWAGQAAYIYPGGDDGSMIADSSWVLLGASFPFSAWGPLQAIDPVYSGVVELHGYFLH
jgi:hypothetical protein